MAVANVQCGACSSVAVGRRSAEQGGLEPGAHHTTMGCQGLEAAKQDSTAAQAAGRAHVCWLA